MKTSSPKTIVIVGGVAGGASAAERYGADMICLGSHGYTGLKHVWLGSTAERVVRHASCPVLAVRGSKRK